MKKLFIAFSFLTLLPVSLKDITVDDIKNSVIFFPWVGAFEGLASFLAVFICKNFLPVEFLALLVLIVIFLIRGIFHLDGLSDTFDALFYKSSGNEDFDRKKRLTIMKDSTVGVGGVCAIFMDLLFKFTLLKFIFINFFYFWHLIFTFSFSRWALLPLMYHGKPAKKEGLGAIFVGNLSFKHILLGSILPFSLLTFYIFKTKKLIFLFFPVFLYLTSFFINRVCIKKFGGITGDNLGATVEISEIIGLFFWGFYG